MDRRRRNTGGSSGNIVSGTIAALGMTNRYRKDIARKTSESAIRNGLRNILVWHTEETHHERLHH